MATVREELLIDVPIDDVWEALADWGAPHERLVPGFVTNARRDGNARIVTFDSGLVLREELVTLDPEARRLVWTIVDGPYEHHNGAAQLFPATEGRTRLVWTTDVLPNEIAPPTRDAMRRGLAAMRRAFNG